MTSGDVAPSDSTPSTGSSPPSLLSPPPIRESNGKERRVHSKSTSDGSMTTIEREYVGDTMDQFLASRGLMKKATARDSSSLFRAACEQISSVQTDHFELRRIVEAELRLPAMEHVGRVTLSGSGDVLFNRERAIVQILADITQSVIIIYTAPGVEPTRVEGKVTVDGREILICETSERGIYTPVYSVEQHERLAITQAIVYRALYEGVFKFQKKYVDGAVAFIRRDIDENNRKVEPATPDDSPETSPEKRKNNESPNPMTTPTKLHSKDLKRIPFPFGACKALDPSIYRNVDYDIYRKKRDELKEAREHASFNSMSVKFLIGSQCLARRDRGEIMTAVVIDIPSAEDRTIYFHDSQMTLTVKVSDLRPPAIVPCGNFFGGPFSESYPAVISRMPIQTNGPMDNKQQQLMDKLGVRIQMMPPNYPQRPEQMPMGYGIGPLSPHPIAAGIAAFGGGGGHPAISGMAAMVMGQPQPPMMLHPMHGQIMSPPPYALPPSMLTSTGYSYGGPPSLATVLSSPAHSVAPPCTPEKGNYRPPVKGVPSSVYSPSPQPQQFQLGPLTAPPVMQRQRTFSYSTPMEMGGGGGGRPITIPPFINCADATWATWMPPLAAAGGPTMGNGGGGERQSPPTHGGSGDAPVTSTPQSLGCRRGLRPPPLSTCSTISPDTNPRRQLFSRPSGGGQGAVSSVPPLMLPSLHPAPRNARLDSSTSGDDTVFASSEGFQSPPFDAPQPPLPPMGTSGGPPPSPMVGGAGAPPPSPSPNFMLNRYCVPFIQEHEMRTINFNQDFSSAPDGSDLPIRRGDVATQRFFYNLGISVARNPRIMALMQMPPLIVPPSPGSVPMPTGFMDPTGIFIPSTSPLFPPTMPAFLHQYAHPGIDGMQYQGSMSAGGWTPANHNAFFPANPPQPR